MWYTVAASNFLPAVVGQVLNTPCCMNQDFHDKIQICTASARKQKSISKSFIIFIICIIVYCNKKNKTAAIKVKSRTAEHKLQHMTSQTFT